MEKKQETQKESRHIGDSGIMEVIKYAVIGPCLVLLFFF